jgi:hypothetical protein
MLDALVRWWFALVSLPQVDSRLILGKVPLFVCLSVASSN